VGQYLAFDLGAESSRVIFGNLDDNGKLSIELLHRSPNSMIDVRGRLCWEIHGMWRDMLQGIGICVSQGKINPDSIGIDTWGVDFGLFDQQGTMIGNPVAYRDRRRRLSMERLLNVIPKKRLYELTGIQITFVNSIFELYSLTREKSPQLNITKDLLFIPDIFNYFLTGQKKTEYTFATTSQLYNTRKGCWENEIFERIGISRSIMQEVVPHGTIIGTVIPSVCKETGLKKTPVIAVASHDTASAVAACPLESEIAAYISSGTWSLMGIESRKPIINSKTLKYNLTNEGGICNTFRILKNLTGLWLLQEYRKESQDTQKYDYTGLSDIALNTPSIGSVIDSDAPEFIKPQSISRAIVKYCYSTGQTTPQNTGEFVRVILESLALAYRHTLHQLKEVSGRKIKQLNIIGGGSQNKVLCQFTADATGLPVYAGPVEATAIGNLLVQAMALGEIESHTELRDIVRRSFPSILYEPKQPGSWDDIYARFLQIKN
jgi:rhamnulokinase